MKISWILGFIFNIKKYSDCDFFKGINIKTVYCEGTNEKKYYYIDLKILKKNRF